MINASIVPSSQSFYQAQKDRFAIQVSQINTLATKEGQNHIGGEVGM